MRHKLILILSLALLSFDGKCEELTLKEAQYIAEQYYTALETVAKNPKTASSMESSVARLFGDSASFKYMRVPNDIASIFSDSPQKGNIDAQTYFTRLANIANSKDIRLQHKIKHCIYLEGPRLSKEDKAEYIEVVVKRGFTRYGAVLKEFTERMVLKIDTKEPFIRNPYGGVIDNSNGAIASAFSLYKQNEYDEAFRMFETALRIDPYSEVASMRLGIMASKGQGCKRYPKKVRDHMAVWYFMKTDKGHETLKYYYGIQRENLHGEYAPQAIMDDNVLRTVLSHFPALLSTAKATLQHQVFPLGHCDVRPFSHNRMLSIDKRTKQFIYITPQGNRLGYSIYQMAFPFDNSGRALVYDGSYWRFIDTIFTIGRIALSPSSQYIHTDHKIYNRMSGTLTEYPKETIICHVFEKPNSPVLTKIRKDNLYGISGTGGDPIYPCVAENLFVINWNQNEVTICVNYDEKKAKEIFSSENYLDQFDPEKWKDLGKILTLKIK